MKDTIEILSVEDDPLQAEWIRQTVESQIRGARVARIATESEFVAKFPQIAANPPALILLDVMLRWADPAPDMPTRLPEVKKGGMQRAGFRCLARLAAHPATKAIPVIVLTVLQNGEINKLDDAFTQMPAHVAHLQKDAGATKLLRKIRELTGRARAKV